MAFCSEEMSWFLEDFSLDMWSWCHGLWTGINMELPYLTRPYPGRLQETNGFVDRVEAGYDI